MDPRTRHHVRQRAGHRCEYCQLTEAQSPVVKLQIEHILPRKHGGSDDPANLALACIDCNLHKGANLTGINPETGRVVDFSIPEASSGRDISRGADASSPASTLSLLVLPALGWKWEHFSADEGGMDVP